MFDDDAAGIKASVRAAEIFMEAGMFVHIASLKDGLDPDEYLNRYGREAFEKLIASAEDPLQFRIKQFFKNRPSPSAQDKAGAIRLLLKTVEKQPDEIVKSEWIKMIASSFNVENESIIRQMEKNSGKKGTPNIEAAGKKNTGNMGNIREDDRRNPLREIPPIETDILQILINSPELIDKNPDLSEKDFSTPEAKKIFSAIKLEKSRINAGNGKAMARALMDAVPESAGTIVSMAASELPDEKNGTAVFAEALVLLKKTSAKKRMQELKQLPEMSPEQMQEYSLLAIELKASGENEAK